MNENIGFEQTLALKCNLKLEFNLNGNLKSVVSCLCVAAVLTSQRHEAITELEEGRQRHSEEEDRKERQEGEGHVELARDGRELSETSALEIPQQLSQGRLHCVGTVSSSAGC